MKAAAQIVARAIQHLLRELQAIGLDALTIHNGQNYCSIYDLFSNPKGIVSLSPAPARFRRGLRRVARREGPNPERGMALT